MVVVVEGIESQEQHAEIVRIGCDYAQGFYFAEPMSESAMMEIDWALPVPNGSSTRREETG